MDPPVFAEDRALAEGLPTDPTHVGLLPGVGPLMLEEVGAPAKAFPTLDALVRFLPPGSSRLLIEWLAWAGDLNFRGGRGTWTQTEALFRFVVSLINPLWGSFLQNHG